MVRLEADLRAVFTIWSAHHRTRGNPSARWGKSWLGTATGELFLDITLATI